MNSPRKIRVYYNEANSSLVNSFILIHVLKQNETSQRSECDGVIVRQCARKTKTESAPEAKPEVLNTNSISIEQLPHWSLDVQNPVET